MGVLAEMFLLWEYWGIWPQALAVVRTHLIGKATGGKGVKGPEDLRPIAIISVWVRLWSKWQLLRLPPEVYDRFPHGITGGLPQRTPQAAMLDMLLKLEEAGGEVSDAPLNILSIDASKCFDRIRFRHALEAGLAFGIPVPHFAGSGGLPGGGVCGSSVVGSIWTRSPFFRGMAYCREIRYPLFFAMYA